VRFVILLLSLGVVVALILPLLRRPAIRARGRPSALDDELVKDPVCQTYVVRSRAVSGGGGAAGAPYFCSTDCARRYSG
jgi:YHS domain-containing protein